MRPAIYSFVVGVAIMAVVALLLARPGIERVLSSGGGPCPYAYAPDQTQPPVCQPSDFAPSDVPERVARRLV